MKASDLKPGQLPQSLMIHRQQMWAVDIGGQLMSEREYPHPTMLFLSRLEAHNQARLQHGTAVKVVVTIERIDQ